MKTNILSLLLVLSLTACTKGSDPRDPFEPYNRKVHKFNMAFDATMIKPPARLYRAVLPLTVRNSIDRAFENVRMLPTIANDVLQGELLQAYKDSWRFILNSTIGVAGFFDPASTMMLPPHSTDLGVTLAKWGDVNSPYFVLPFFGPSTIRDTAGWFLDYATFTVYPHIEHEGTRYGLLGLRYLELRAALLDKEDLLEEALDQYAFIRDAYLQHRQYKINGDTPASSEDLYIDELGGEEASEKIDLTDEIAAISPQNRSLLG